jgi:hypothetical protein
MRGQSIEALTAKVHRMAEWIAERRLPITTIGIGDGGNELGMGRFAWELLVQAGGQVAGRIACRVGTDFTLIGGVSDWAAYALTLGMAKLRDRSETARGWRAGDQRELIGALVKQAGLVDGVTLRREPTVDGLSLDAYLRPLVEMRQSLGLGED